MLRLVGFLPHLFLAPDDGAGGAGGGGSDDATKALADARAKLAELEKRESERLAADKAREEKEAAERGEHAKLAEKYKSELDEKTGRLTELEKREKARMEKIEARNVERVKKIPEAKRSLVPASLKGEDLADYLETNAALLFDEEERPAGGAPRAKPRADEKIPDECVAEAKRHGVPAETWFRTIYKPRMDAAAKKQAGAAS